MPDWNQLLNECNALGSQLDVLRRKYVALLHEATRRNVIIYYSGWLQKPQLDWTAINDEDKNGFMSTIHEMDRSKGLDLVLHTPGGDVAATESIVDYLRRMFGTDIRAIVPQLAMSGGTMICLACREILMGKQSSLGPIDPQFRGIPAHGVIEEFETARKEIKEDPANIPLWQPVIAKYHPTLIGECQKAITWSERLTREWLSSGIFSDDPEKDAKIERVWEELGSHALTLSHERHLSAERCRELGLTVVMLEDDQAMQDAVLSVHHATMLTLDKTAAAKIIENHMGRAYIKLAQQMVVARPG